MSGPAQAEESLVNQIEVASFPIELLSKQGLMYKMSAAVVRALAGTLCVILG